MHVAHSNHRIYHLHRVHREGMLNETKKKKTDVGHHASKKQYMQWKNVKCSMFVKVVSAHDESDRTSIPSLIHHANGVTEPLLSR